MEILLNTETKEITFQSEVTVEDLLHQIVELKKSKIISGEWKVCPHYTYSGITEIPTIWRENPPTYDYKITCTNCTNGTGCTCNQAKTCINQN